MALLFLGLGTANASELSNANNLRSNFEIITSFDATPLCVAISKGDFDLVKKLVEYGADVNGKIQRGTTPLMMAARYNNAEITRFLLSKGAKLNTEDNEGHTALDHAKSVKAIDVIQVLTEAKKKK
jgi:ankyrin repeat protein